MLHGTEAIQKTAGLFSLNPGKCPLSKFSGHLAILVCVLKRKPDKLYMAGNIGGFLKRMYTFFELRELFSGSSLPLEDRGVGKALALYLQKEV